MNPDKDCSEDTLVRGRLNFYEDSNVPIRFKVHASDASLLKIAMQETLSQL